MFCFSLYSTTYALQTYRSCREKLLSDLSTHRTDVGKFNFLTNTRLDLAFVVQMLSPFMHQPRTSHWGALLYTLQYVELLDKEYCFMLMRVKSYRRFQIPIGLPALPPGDPSPVMCFSLVILPSVGNLKNSLPLPDHLLKLRIEQWQRPQPKLLRWFVCLANLVFLTSSKLLCIMIINLLFTLRGTPYFTSTLNT